VFDLLGTYAACDFPASELELARTRALSALALQLSQPARWRSGSSGRRSTAATPMAERHARSYGPSPATTYPVHSATAAAGRRAARGRGRRDRRSGAGAAAKAFAGWRGAPPSSPALPLPHAGRDRHLLVHRPARAGEHCARQHDHPADRPDLLSRPRRYSGPGRGADSRMFLILREQKAGRTAPTPPSIATADWLLAGDRGGPHDVADSALRETLHQIDRIRTEVIPTRSSRPRRDSSSAHSRSPSRRRARSRARCRT